MGYFFSPVVATDGVLEYGWAVLSLMLDVLN